MKVVAGLIPLLPFAGFLITLVGGKWWLRRRPEVVPALVSVASWALGVYVFARVFADREEMLRFTFFSWMTSGSFSVVWGFQIDALTAVMLLVVGTIGIVVHVYSIGFMKDDEGCYRFFAYLDLLMSAMYVLILADSYLLMFLGWEGVGACAYLVISFWFSKKNAAQAGKKAFLVDRVGGAGFLLAVLLVFLTFGSSRFVEVFPAAGDVGSTTLLGICLLLFAGAVARSAQFPLHVWLPDAVGAPAPAGALIHTVTVTGAGVYMVARSYPLFNESEAALYVVMGVGMFTALYAALVAITQNDVRRVLACSTVSSLGFMFVLLGSGGWVAGVFCLLAHGFLKSVLVLGSGSVIRAMSGVRDMHLMGALRRKLPLTYWTMMVGSVGMVGLFASAGFWARDETVGSGFTHHYHVIWIMGGITAFVTGISMFRLMFLTFHGESRAAAEVQDGIHESPAIVTVPLVVLAVSAALVGVLAVWPPDNGWTYEFLRPVFFDVGSEPFGTLGLALLLVSLAVGAAGAVTAWYLYVARPQLPGRIAARVPWAYRASSRGFYQDEALERAIVRPLLRFAGWLSTFVDVKVIDGAVNGAARLPAALGRALRRLPSGGVQMCILGILAGVLVLLAVIGVF